MTLKRRSIGLGLAFVAAALIFSVLAVTESHAQTPPAPPKATATATPAIAPAAAPKAVIPAKTGSAGLPVPATPLATVLVLGVIVLTLVAGARTATRER